MARCVICKTSFTLLNENERWIYKTSGLCLKCFDAKAEEWAKDIINTFRLESQHKYEVEVE